MARRQPPRRQWGSGWHGRYRCNGFAGVASMGGLLAADGGLTPNIANAGFHAQYHN